jgi:hypothetical protein
MRQQTHRTGLVCLAALTIGCAAASRPYGGLRSVAALPDISGMSWMPGERLLVVHDAKRSRPERDRVGLVWLPTDTSSLRHLPLDLPWPGTGPSHDLESIAPIPGTPRAVLVESGDDGDGPGAPQLYLVELRDDRLTLLERVAWPEAVHNVEATAIVAVQGQLVFVYAERNHGAATSALRWATLQLDPLRFGAFEEFRFASPTLPPLNRAIVALDAAPSGRLYAAGSYDPDVDTGPFRSDIFRLGRFEPRPEGGVRYDGRLPERLFTVDGTKIEALAVRTLADGTLEIIYGTDDEDFGGIIRRLRHP